MKRPDAFSVAAGDDVRSQDRSSNAVADKVVCTDELARDRVAVLVFGRDHVHAVVQAVLKYLLEAVFAVRPALRRVQVITPATERQVATEAARRLDVILGLAAVVDTVVGEYADASEDAIALSRLELRRYQRAAGDIVDGELPLAVLLRLAPGDQQFAVELTVAEEVGVIGGAQVTRVIAGRRNNVLLEQRGREGVPDVAARADRLVCRRVQQASTDAFESRQQAGRD